MAVNMQDEWKKVWPQIVAKAWIDPQYAASLNDPDFLKQELRNHGFPVDDQLTYKLLPVAADEVIFALPPPPPAPGSSDVDDLEKLAKRMHICDLTF